MERPLRWNQTSSVDRRGPGFWAIPLLALCLGCGSSDPVGSPQGPASGARFEVVYVTQDAFDSYLAQVLEAARPMPVMVREFEAITQDWFSQRTTDYWTLQFTLNLVARVETIEEGVKRIRPEDPQLGELHTEFEAALAMYVEAFTDFANQITFRSQDLLAAVNEKVRQGNVHLIRFQVLMGYLAGREITF